MTYLPHTDADRQAMLAAIGVARLEDLFDGVPAHARFPALDLPAALSEMEIEREMRAYAERNRGAACFLGAGAWRHFIPSTVDYVLRRGEFYTSYTPYQPEISQGMLQAMFEYQSMVCRLTGMDVSNASHYDGATALAEAVLLALNAGTGKRAEVILSPGIHPQYRAVVSTYLRGTDASVPRVDAAAAEPHAIRSLLGQRTAALVIQNPNFLGQFEDVRGLADKVHRAGALLIVVVDPISLGLFQPPGAYGADVVVADGQPFGIPPSFGGPHLGILATRKALVRRIPGRLVGETVDAAGARGYVLTLATREQHIRRAKATSNICTNAALSALAATVYLATMGKAGLRHVAALCYHKSHYAAGAIARRAGLKINPWAPGRPYFREFAVALDKPVAAVNAILLDRFGIIGGYDLGADDPHLARHMLVSVTEMNTKDEIDRLAEALRQAAA